MELHPDEEVDGAAGFGLVPESATFLISAMVIVFEQTLKLLLGTEAALCVALATTPEIVPE